MKTFQSADILLPKNADLTKWSVVACDQYTSEPEYWSAVEKQVSDAPSTLQLIFPEIYLNEEASRIEKINQNMQAYINSGIFKEEKNCMIYVKRTVGGGKIRHGLIGCVDLEQYDFKKGSGSLIRATEGTVLERIPPRVKIRENAPLELPHIMILIDDPEKTIIEPLEENLAQMQQLYDFDLMQNSGHLSGYRLTDGQMECVYREIDKLGEQNVFHEKYQVSNKPVLQFAVGDGNHSLATAKTCWENVKKSLSEEEQKTHPARYALVELVNLHDESLEFEPIHRVVFDVNPEHLLQALFAYYPEVSYEDNGGQWIGCHFAGMKKDIYVKGSQSNLSVGTLQNFLDEYLRKNGGNVDYIHGEEVVTNLSRKENIIGFYLPNMEKSDLFKTVILDGALPRKTFSMGEAWEKRFYMEAKAIR